MKMQPSSLEQMAYDAAHPEEVNCMNCDGACCREKLFMAAKESEVPVVINPVRWVRPPTANTQVFKEKVWLVSRTERGARFVRVEATLEVPAGHGLVEFDEDCLQVDEDGKCKIYDHKPGQCGEGLDPGSPECLGYRAVYAARLAGELG